MMVDGNMLMRNGGNTYEGVAKYYTTFILNNDRTRWAASGYDWTQMPTDPAPIVSLDFNVIPDTDMKPVAADLDGDGKKEIGLVEGVSAAGLQLVTEARAPVSVMAHFRRDGSGTHYAPPETNTVTVSSWAIVYKGDSAALVPFSGVAGVTVPETTVVAVPGRSVSVADSASVEVPAIDAGFTVPSTVEDSTGGVWRCVGWMESTTGLEGATAAAGFKVSADGA
jgi:hypothetical protein